MAPVFSRGDVLLTQFPFTDLTGKSVRPALVVSHGLIGQDLILAGISSVVRGPLAPSDFTLNSIHPEFGLTGLRVTSVLRLHKLVAIEYFVIARRLGRIGPQLQNEVDRLLRIVLGL